MTRQSESSGNDSTISSPESDLRVHSSDLSLAALSESQSAEARFQPSSADVTNFLSTESPGMTGFARSDLRKIIETAPETRTRQLAKYLEQDFDQIRRLSSADGLVGEPVVKQEKITTSDLSLFAKLLQSQKSLEPLAKSTAAFLENNFAVIDTDTDGRISRPEIQNMKETSLPDFGLKERKEFILNHFDGLTQSNGEGRNSFSKEDVKGQRINGFLNSAWKRIHNDHEMEQNNILPATGEAAGALLAINRLSGLDYGALKQGLMHTNPSINPRAAAFTYLAAVATYTGVLMYGGRKLGELGNSAMNNHRINNHFIDEAQPAMKTLLLR